MHLYFTKTSLSLVLPPGTKTIYKECSKGHHVYGGHGVRMWIASLCSIPTLYCPRQASDLSRTCMPWLYVSRAVESTQKRTKWMFGLKNVLVIHYVLNSNFFIWFVELNGLTITPHPS